MKTALITGITGQDGSYLAELLLAKGYEVHGIIRRSSSFATERIDGIFDRLHLHYGDMADGARLRAILDKASPDEVYHLAAQSHVRVSFDVPEYTLDCVATGTARLLEVLRVAPVKVRIFIASSSEMFGGGVDLDESSPLNPRSPYAVAKVAAHNLAGMYREAYGMWIARGIMFNHESPRRGPRFVTRKITRAAARIALGLQDKLELGNLDARRDWGYAPEYMQAAWMMLQRSEPDDFVIGTGESHSVREFMEAVFASHGLTCTERVVRSERLTRPCEVDELRANPKRARELLGWTPKITFAELALLMARTDSAREFHRAKLECV